MKMSKKITVSFLLIFILVFSVISRANAVLGPVHVEINKYYNFSARANSVTAFSVYFRLNKNIEVYDWIKIWFPIDEASCDPEDICDGPLEIKGHDESPRFVPNEKYFGKYDNPKEKKIGKLYTVHEPYEMDTDFYDCLSCKNPDDKCRIVPDKSGLGCWIMGTVMPSLPRDKEQRIIRSHQIEHTTSIGYSPCGDCGQGGVQIVQNEHERSLRVLSPVGVEAWRQGYNPIDINTSKATGIITPATPGRYRVSVATQAEPTPVESDAFVLPCSEITKPLFSKNKDGDYELKFNVGEGGALDAGNSLINIDIPKCFKIKKKYLHRFISINGKNLKTDPKIIPIDNGYRMVLISSVDANSFEEVYVRIKSRIFENICDESMTVKVSTSSEPEMIESTLLKEYVEEIIPEISNSLLGKLHLTSNIAGEKTGISFILDARELDVNKYSEFKITLPAGSYIPENLQNAQFLVNRDAVGKFIRRNKNTISLWMNTRRNIDDYTLRFIRFELTEYAKIRNPEKPGLYNIFLTIDKELPIKSHLFEIVK